MSVLPKVVFYVVAFFAMYLVAKMLWDKVKSSTKKDGENKSSEDPFK